MDHLLLISRRMFSDLLRQEVENAPSYPKLRGLSVQRAAHDFSLALVGELDESTHAAREALQASLAERSASDLAAGMVADQFALRAEKFRTDRPPDEQLAEVAVQTVAETAGRMGRILADDAGAHFHRWPADEEVEVDWEEEEGTVVLVKDEPTPGLDLDDLGLFGETEAPAVDWWLSETVRRIHCIEETPGYGADDIVFQGRYRFRTDEDDLDVTSEEIEYDRGDEHSYDTGDQEVPHSKVFLPVADAPHFYLSSHVLTESDAWTEVAGAVAAFLQRLVEGPGAAIGGALAGQVPFPGAGFAGELAGSAVDEALDSLSDGLLTRTGRWVRESVYDAIASIGVDDNIVFEPWYTGVRVSWPPVGEGEERRPRWRAVHSVPGVFLREAESTEENPVLGQGSLRPGRFAGQTDVRVRPAVWDHDEYGPYPRGSYGYTSEVRVVREVTSSQPV